MTATTFPRSFRKTTTTVASITAIGDAVANLAVYGAGRLGQLDFLVRFSDSQSWSRIGAVQVGVVTVLAVFLGSVLVSAAGRRSVRWARLTRAAGAAFAVISATTPLSVSAMDPGVKPLLALMHLVAGAGFLYATRRR